MDNDATLLGKSEIPMLIACAIAVYDAPGYESAHFQCVAASEIFAALLHGTGVSVEIVEITASLWNLPLPANYGLWGVSGHAIVRVTFPSGQAYLVDPSAAQLADRPSDVTTKILVWKL